ncbi:PREDICTED: phospholipid scramblase 1-like [Rhagoletis zephyria]|uniref:phospholipid scramblase 1-like n=1 Tax=Rhagoletis zephyria TaxID=28612 RepID=UPI0008116E68|nr:PREDICTED: phospholipid scramblase 1-like [Rhagoletis zephyria]
MAPPPPRALVNPNCPPGLEYLTQVDQLVVIQEVDMLQVFTGYESHNRYSVKNAANQNVYYCVETSDVLTMNLMHSDRPFEIIVMDNFGVPVLRASRPYHFGSILCGCPDLLQVSTGNGQPLGTVQEQFKCCGSRFTVHDANGGVVLFLEGPPCRFDFLDTEFEVLTTDEAKVGAVTRQFPGFFKELYTKADVFGVHFPVDLQVEVKALLLCSTFLIDFMFYQQKDNEKNDGGFGGSSSNDSNNDRGRSRSPRRSVSRNSPDVDMNMGLGNSMDVDMNMGL